MPFYGRTRCSAWTKYRTRKLYGMVRDGICGFGGRDVILFDVFDMGTVGSGGACLCAVGRCVLCVVFAIDDKLKHANTWRKSRKADVS